MFGRENGNFVVKINSGTIARTIIIGFLFVLLYRVRDLVLIILTAIVIASAIEPATRWFKKFGVPRLASVLATYLTAALVCFSLVYFILPSLLGDLSNFLGAMPSLVDSLAQNQKIESTEITKTAGTLSTLSEGLNQSEGVFKNIADTVKSSGKGQGDSTKNATLSESSFVDIVNNLKDALSNVSQSFAGLVSLIFGGVFSFSIIIVLSFYFAVQENGIANFLRVITPLQHEKYVIDLWQRSQQKIGYWMQGQILLAVLVGVLAYLGLTILGVKDALLFAFSAALFEIIPLFGPILAALPPIVSAFAGSGLTLALMVTGLFIIIQQFENHLIYPLVVKKIVGVPPILVIVALIAGAELAGFLGIILSVPIAAAVMEYFTDIEKRKHGNGDGQSTVPAV